MISIPEYPAYSFYGDPLPYNVQIPKKTLEELKEVEKDLVRAKGDSAYYMKQYHYYEEQFNAAKRALTNERNSGKQTVNITHNYNEDVIAKQASAIDALNKQTTELVKTIELQHTIIRSMAETVQAKRNFQLVDGLVDWLRSMGCITPNLDYFIQVWRTLVR